MEGAKTAPVDMAGSYHLAGTVYSRWILPLPAERHPQQQRDHLHLREDGRSSGVTVSVPEGTVHVLQLDCIQSADIQ